MNAFSHMHFFVLYSQYMYIRTVAQLLFVRESEKKKKKKRSQKEPVIRRTAIVEHVKRLNVTLNLSMLSAI